MALGRHVALDHPLKGRMKYLPALLCPAEFGGPDESTVDPLVSRDANPTTKVTRTAGEKRKRTRAARACELCKAKKYRCDERDPCGKCEKRHAPCVYKDADLARKRLHAAVTEGNGARGGDHQVREDHGTREGRQQHQTSQDEEHREVIETRQVHGPTSLVSLAAIPQPAQSKTPTGGRESEALVSAFYDQSFPRDPALQQSGESQSLFPNRHYFPHFRHFLEGYFQSLHYIHPVIDRVDFLARCEDLWLDRLGKQPRSFVALYYAVMSLGALTGDWEEDDSSGLDRFDWSRMLFRYAANILNPMPECNDLETVQANLVMAKVCQNELASHLAYRYLGTAVRTALSAGFNRRIRHHPSVAASQSGERSAIAKTWWGLYSLEVEMSFARGRPDSLGLDVYHDQAMPPLDDSEHSILNTMVDFARIIRRVSIFAYASSQMVGERLDEAEEIDNDIDAWAEALPRIVSPLIADEEQAPRTSKSPAWLMTQRHALKLRYLNVKIVLYRHLVVYAAAKCDSTTPRFHGAVEKSVAAARNTIQSIYQRHCNTPYLRTWLYDVTYILYAASTLLWYTDRFAAAKEKTELQELIDMSVEVLNSMKRHVLAGKAATILQQASAQVQNKSVSSGTTLPQQPHQPVGSPLDHRADVSAEMSHVFPTTDLSSDPSGESDLDFISRLLPLDDDLLSLWRS